MTAGEVEVFFVAVGVAPSRAVAANASEACTRESSFQRTFRRCQEADLAPQLIDVSAAAGASSLNDAAELEPPLKDNAVYVFDSFEGETFERLQARRCRVYGAPCVERCLDRGESLPKVGHPVYSFVMRGAVVCCTNMPADQRTQLYRLVQYMGGEVSRDFTEVVTHLIALTVGSKKYEVAAERRLPVLLPDWVLTTWRRCCSADEGGQDFRGGGASAIANALEPAYMAQFACPVFKGLVITASALPNRKDVRDLIERHGGVFTGEMRSGECTHLVINEPTGKKYEHAVRWNIAVVRPQWLLDCVQAGYHIAERPYGFDGRVHCASSTPNSTLADSTDTTVANRRPMPALLDVSAIGASASMARANVTVQSCDGNATAPIPAGRDPLDDISPATDGGFFLDGCRVYVHGFATPRLDKVRKLIDSSGAVRIGTLTQKPTHVLADDRAGAAVDAPGLAAMLHLVSPTPHVVTVMWLIECFKQERLVDVGPFAISLSLSAGPSRLTRSSQLAVTPVKQLQPVNVPTGPSVMQAELLRRPLAVCNDANASAVEVASEAGVAAAKRLPSAVGKSWSEKDRDILSQYMDDWTAGDSSLAKPAVANAAGDGRIVAAAVNAELAAGESAVPTAVAPILREGGAAQLRAAVAPAESVAAIAAAAATFPAAAVVPLPDVRSTADGSGGPATLPDGDGASDDDRAGGQCLRGKKFTFRGFVGDDLVMLQSLVVEHGGAIVAVDRADYVVEPLEGFDEESGDRLASSRSDGLVTATWLQACLEADRLLPVDSCPLFQRLVPLGCGNGSSPLSGCVVSVSGFVGAVREAIYHVVQLAGGQPQETLAKKSTGAVQATTHLLVAEPTGRKYDAARTWGIPTLTLAWLLDSVRHGARQPEACYSTAAAPSSAVVKSAGATVAMTAADSATAAAAAASNSADARRSVSGGSCGVGPDRQVAPEPAAACVPTPVRAAAAVADGSCTSFVPIQRSSGGGGSGGSGSSSSGGPGRQLRDIAATAAATPAVLAGRRPPPGPVVSHDAMTPMTKSHKFGIDTPSKWLNPDVSFHPGFDLSCVGGDYAATAAHAAAGATARSPRRRSSLPMAELLSKHLQMALEAQQPSESLMPRPPVTPRGGGGAAARMAAGAQVRRSRLRNQQQQPQVEVATAWAADCATGGTSCDSQPAAAVGTVIDGASSGLLGNSSPAVVRRSARLQGDAGAVPFACAEDTNIPAGCGGSSGSRQQQLRRSEPAADETCQGVAREAALCDQLQSFMSTTRKTKSERRRSRKRAASTADDDDVGVALSSRSDRGSTAGGSGSSGGGRASAATAPAAAAAAESAPDPSQRVQVMWDDAISREEARKLAEHLDRASCPMDDDQGSAALAQRRHGALHNVPGCALGNEGRAHGDSHVGAAAAGAALSSCPAFLLSGLMPDERDAFSAIVRSLGGTLIDAPAFDERCTHLVVSKPSRNEKFLACVATGKWILHPSYFEACRRASRFVDEGPYEWGGDDMAAVCRQLGDATVKLAAAARRWRLQAMGSSAAHERKRGSSAGLSRSTACRAFADWRAVVCTEEAKEGGFRRLLEAGGATVVATRPPFDAGLCATAGMTHAFVDLRRTKYTAADFHLLLRQGVLCLKPDYIAAYLTDETTPNVVDFQVAELRPSGADVSISSVGEKRRLLTTANNSSPRKRPR